jgi:hypothetical protein
MLWISSADHSTQKENKRQNGSKYYGPFVREEYVQDIMMVRDSDFLEDLLRVASGDERCAFMWESFPSDSVRANLHEAGKKTVHKERIWGTLEGRRGA